MPPTIDGLFLLKLACHKTAGDRWRACSPPCTRDSDRGRGGANRDRDRDRDKRKEKRMQQLDSHPTSRGTTRVCPRNYFLARGCLQGHCDHLLHLYATTAVHMSRRVLVCAARAEAGRHIRHHARSTKQPTLCTTMRAPEALVDNYT